MHDFYRASLHASPQHFDLFAGLLMILVQSEPLRHITVIL